MREYRSALDDLPRPEHLDHTFAGRHGLDGVVERAGGREQGCDKHSRGAGHGRAGLVNVPARNALGHPGLGDESKSLDFESPAPRLVTCDCRGR